MLHYVVVRPCIGQFPRPPAGEDLRTEVRRIAGDDRNAFTFMGCRMKLDGKARKWSIWIFFFAGLAAPFWPQPLGLVFMALAFFGVIHQAVLVYDQINEDRINSMNPYEYEHYCAELLERRKWRTEVTKASCDQGVDIIAIKRGVRIVLQCKKYTKPIGNHAVQQIVAAIAHEKADRGVVVATSAFTPAAISLAASNNILLLHHSELPGVERLLRRSSTQAQ